jgi:hypothetical protein
MLTQPNYTKFDLELTALWIQMKEYIETFTEPVWFSNVQECDNLPGLTMVGWVVDRVVCDDNGKRVYEELNAMSVTDLLFIIGEIEC